MSAHISEIYAAEIYDNLRPLYANWEPSQPIALGDFGQLQGRIFIRLGNIQDSGISFQERKDARKDHKFFTSKGSTEVKFNAGGSAPAAGAVNIKANLEVSFSTERAVFFNAAECEYSMIANKVALGDEIMQRYRSKPSRWDRSWTVVTDVIVAGATTIAISGAKSSSIMFEATGNVPNINLADASAGLAVKTARNVGYQVVAAQGLVPLIGLARIKPRFLWVGDNFRPLAKNVVSPLIRATLEASEHVQSEQSPEELIFAQVE